MSSKQGEQQLNQVKISDDFDLERSSLNENDVKKKQKQQKKITIQDKVEVRDIQLAPSNEVEQKDQDQKFKLPQSQSQRLFKNPVMRRYQSMEIQAQQSFRGGLSKKLSQKLGYGDKDWHLMNEQALFKHLKTDKKGLTSEEAKIRLERDGFNQITPVNLVQGFQLMMWVGAILCFIVFGISTPPDTQMLVLGIVLVLVVVITSVFQQYQEGKQDEVMKALRALSPTEVSVLRDGQLQTLNAIMLVKGDIVKVRAGEKVPADVRVLESSDLKVNNSSLTGENVDIKLGIQPVSDILYEAKNIARSGCNFTSGSATCVVFETGDNTFFGNIAKSTTQIKHPDTLIKKEIHRLIYVMAVFAIILGIVFFILARLNGYSWVESIIFFIGIFVANVPEGLLPQITVALTLTAQRMLKVNVLVQNLEIIETLGAVSIICSDKTGTLTQNKMTVVHVVYNNKIHITPYAPQQKDDNFPLYNREDDSFQILQQIGSLNSDAVFLKFDEDYQARECKGDASESAIIKFFDPLRNIEKYRQECKRLHCIPFNSSNKWMCSINEQSGSDKDTKPLSLLFKGAPEKIMNKCTTIYINKQIIELTEELRESMDDINELLAGRGERVLAFAKLDLSRDKYPPGFKFDGDQDDANFPLEDLTLIGFLALVDPPRLQVKDSIGLCNKAGIKVFMVTGDQQLTAHAIAKSLNIITGPTEAELEELKQPIPPEGVRSIVVHGQEMAEFKEVDWKFVLGHQEIVFARTMPQQKQDIVRELNKLGHVVAMTGDGVNDGPALKAANVGIAMGSGSAVAKQAGQIILLNDDFSSIVKGIFEGRMIFDNLKKFITYVLSSNIPEIIPFLLFIAMKIPLGLETIMILFIDVGTDLAPAVALAYEHPEQSIMEQPPRKQTDHIITLRLMIVAYSLIGIFQTIGAYFAWYYVFYDLGETFDSLIGSGIEYRTAWKSLSSERKLFFYDMCLKNKYYYEHYQVANQKNCMQDYVDFRIETLATAQTAFLMTVVWTQIANIIARKTQMSTVFTIDRMFKNRQLLYALLIEISLICGLVYIPKLNRLFMLRHLDSKYASSALWSMGLIIIFEELRKFFIRQNPKGWIARATKF